MHLLHFFIFIAVPARRRPDTSLTLPTISPSQCLSALVSVVGYCPVPRAATRRPAASGDRQRCGCCLVRHDRRPTAASKTRPVPATTLEQPFVTQPVPSPAPAPRPALQAAPALRGPSVPVVAPVGGGGGVGGGTGTLAGTARDASAGHGRGTSSKVRRGWGKGSWRLSGVKKVKVACTGCHHALLFLHAVPRVLLTETPLCVLQDCCLLVWSLLPVPLAYSLPSSLTLRRCR